MKKLNIGRMKRHMARSTPDTIVVDLDAVSDPDVEQTYMEAMRRFQNRMDQKHGTEKIKGFHAERVYEKGNFDLQYRVSVMLKGS